MVDEKVFFHDSTLAICGDLDIENALHAWLKTLRTRIPADKIFMQLYEPDLGAMRTLAIVTEAGGERCDLLTALPEEAQAVVKRNLTRFTEQATIVEAPGSNPVAREMMRFHGIEGGSVLRMTLVTEHGRLGGIVLTTVDPDRYTGEHVRLLTLLRKPFTIAMTNVLRHREVVRLKEKLADDNRYLQGELLGRSGTDIIGADFGLSEVMRHVSQVAPTDSAVMLTGETGSGKDVIANAIHLGSPRRNGPFVAVNCGAIPQSLIDSELFGHEKGAFTGALATKRGRFERADGGTILLDEIGDMPLEAQVRLLRILQNREIERVGGVKAIPVDTRVIAATNKDLRSLVKAGAFREDLYYRINVFPIHVPPLRDRPGDIPALVQHFVATKARELKIGRTPGLAPGAIDVLTAYDWPGNVRELQNVVERAMILFRGEPLRFDDLGPGARSPDLPSRDALAGSCLELDSVVAAHIRRVLDRCGFKISGPGGAAEVLGVNPNTLRDRMRKLGIDYRKARKSR